MAVTCYELADSRSFNVTSRGATETQRWIAFGEQESQLVYDALIAATPARVGGLVRQQLDPKHQGGGVWLVTIDYSSGIDANSGVGSSPNEPVAPGPDDPLDPSGTGGGGQGPPGGGGAEDTQGFVASFDTTGGTQHITQSLETVLSRAANDPVGGPSTAPDHKGAIGVTETDVAGCDVFVGKLEFSITIKRSVTLAYIDTLEELTGTVNDRPFWRRETGEVLFLGASGQHTTGGVFSVTYKFARSKNRLRVQIGPDILVPRVGGWNYLWVGYKTEASNGREVKVPAAAYVERVYPEKDFRRLGIG